MVDLIARMWERPVEYARKPARAQYSASWSSISSMLKGELRHISARRAVIEMDVSEADIRNDGWIRSNARPRTPGVRLSFECKYGALVYEASTWNSWEHNVYAIARTLRAQRMIARDGCVKGDQVYRGWKQLPSSANPNSDQWHTVEEAMRFLCKVGQGQILSILRQDLDPVYKSASRKAHPDAGGSNELMSRVNAARDYVQRCAGVRTA